MTADAAAAEPVTSNDTTSNDVAGEHVTGDETPREQRTRSEKDIMTEGPYELIVKRRLFLGSLLVDDHGS